MKKNLLLYFCLFFLWSCAEGSLDEMAPALTDSFKSAAGPNTGNNNGETAGKMTAGEWNDLTNWGFWQNLMQNPEYAAVPTAWKITPLNRIAVQLQNSQTQPLTNIKLELLDEYEQVVWRARTDNLGKAELWVNMFNQQGTANTSKLKLKANGQILNITGGLKTYSNGVNAVTLPNINNAATKKLEVAFVVDATGSMGDELSFLKTELLDVINRVKQNNQNVSVRLGSVFYRDKDDEYLTRKSDISADINQTVNFIKAQKADGGGDFPEAVHSALQEGINHLDWSDAATARILFLVLDAPPHNNPEIMADLRVAMGQAAQKGIKIIPVTASGIDKSTEFLMRLFAIGTNGTYVFITNHSGIGNDHLEASVGPYEVEYLNDLMVRLLNKSLE